MGVLPAPLQLAADRGLAVVAGQPFLGGRLVRRLPELVARLWVGRRPAEWGLRWVLAHPQVSTVVVDMASVAEVHDNAVVASASGPGGLTVDEEVLVSRVREAYLKLRPVPCTACRSCMPCPQGIDVPRIFELYNEAVMYDDPAVPGAAYRAERHDIGACDRCGVCAARCGMGVAISDRLAEALRKLD